MLILSAGCAAGPRVKYTPPPMPPLGQYESVVPDKNDTTGEVGLWMSRGDAAGVLKERNTLRSVIEQLRAYWEKTQ